MKKLFALFFSLFLVLTVTQTANAWYGAGYSKNWPETVHGTKGKVLSPTYQTPPNAYNTGDTIALKFAIENPENNNEKISQDLYLHIWKVNKINADKQTVTEDKLYQDHNQKKDSQSFYHTVTLGQLVLSPGDSSTFEVSFTILDPGYYQFDLTDQDRSHFSPGHIYAAGFLRIKNSGDKGILGTKTSSTDSFWKKVLLISGLALALLTALFFLWKRNKRPE